jgi:hypothetical protein
MIQARRRACLLQTPAFVYALRRARIAYMYTIVDPFSPLSHDKDTIPWL